LFFADLKSTNSSPVKVKKEYKEEIVDYRMKLGIGEEGEVKRERKKSRRLWIVREGRGGGSLRWLEKRSRLK